MILQEDRFNLAGVCFDFYDGHQEVDKAYQDFLDNKLDYADGYLTIPAQNGFLYICHDKDGNIIDKYTKLELL